MVSIFVFLFFVCAVLISVKHFGLHDCMKGAIQVGLRNSCYPYARAYPPTCHTKYVHMAE